MIGRDDPLVMVVISLVLMMMILSDTSAVSFGELNCER